MPQISAALNVAPDRADHARRQYRLRSDLPADTYLMWQAFQAHWLDRRGALVMPPAELLSMALFGVDLPAPDNPDVRRLDMLLPPELHAKIKDAAAAADQPMSQWLAARLRDRLAPPAGGSCAKAWRRDSAAAARAARRQEP